MQRSEKRPRKRATFLELARGAGRARWQFTFLSPFLFRKKKNNEKKTTSNLNQKQNSAPNAVSLGESRTLPSSFYPSPFKYIFYALIKNRGVKRPSTSFYRDGDFFSLPASTRASAVAAAGRRRRRSSRVTARTRVRGPCRRSSPLIFREGLRNIRKLHTVRFYGKNKTDTILARERKVLFDLRKMTVLFRRRRRWSPRLCTFDSASEPAFSRFRYQKLPSFPLILI